MKYSALALPLLLAVAGCASQAPTETGFLGDYSLLQPVAAHPDNRGWHKEAVVTPYWGFIVDEVVYRPAKDAPALDAKTVTTLTGEYRARLNEAFAVRLRPADAAAPGVVRIRAAVTNVGKVQPLLNAVTMAAVFFPVTYGGASTESEILDSVTGERIAAYEGYNNGGRSFLGGPIGFLAEYGQARRAFSIQAEELRDLLPTGAAKMQTAHQAD